MINQKFKDLKHQTGKTLVELLIAAGLGIVASVTALKLYTNLQYNGQAQQIRAFHDQNSRAIERFLKWHIAKAGYSADYDTHGFEKEDHFEADGVFVEGSVVYGENGSSGWVSVPEFVEYRYRGDDSGTIVTCAGDTVPLNHDADPITVTEKIYVDDNDYLVCEVDAYPDAAGLDRDNNNPAIIAANIDHFEVQYGVQTSSPTASTSNQIESLRDADDFSIAPATPADWARVKSVRVLLVHHSQRDMYTSDKTFSLLDFDGDNRNYAGNPRRYHSKHNIAINLFNMMK